MASPMRFSFLKELRRRRVFRVAGLYIVTAWVLMQVADVVFPAWDIPDAAIRFLVGASLVGFPLALVFGWVFDITPDGIRRTQPAASSSELQHSLPLRRADYLILAAFLVVIGAIAYETSNRIIGVATLAGTPATAATDVELNSVAVMPFASLSADAEHEFFALGVAEEILDRLATFRELRVIARNSSFAFKDSSFDAAQISGLLSVRYLLQGSVRRDGQRLRVATRLVDSTGRQIWSDTFDRELGAIFAMQDEIAETVANSILPHIVALPATARVPDIEAFREFVIGRELMARRAPGYLFSATEHFDRAIELDPQFAEPYAARAIMTILRPTAGELDTGLVRRDIAAALALNPALAAAHGAEALLMQHEDPHGHAAREAVLRRALTFDPNYVDGLNWLAGALTAQGRRTEALQLYERAVRIDPLAAAVNANLAGEELITGRFDEAQRRLQHLLAAPQPSVLTYFSLIDLYHVTGQLADGLEIGKQMVLSAIPRAGGRLGPASGLVDGYALLGLRGQSEHWLERWIESFPEPHPVRRYHFLHIERLAGHQGPKAAIAQARALMMEDGLELEAAPPGLRMVFGILQALAGEHEGAIQTLSAMTDADLASWGHDIELDALQSLAWARLQVGATEAAAALKALDERLREQHAAGRLHRSDDLFAFARNAVLLGDGERALERLDQATEAGWRRYLGMANDPRWNALRGEPRFEALMAAVRSKLADERARAEAADAAENFEALVDAALAQQKSASATPEAAPTQRQ
jgi:TolB-like protein/tetratricopeptide (TPR) repeat protein